MFPAHWLCGVKINTATIFLFCAWSSCWCVWHTIMWRLTCKLADSNINKFQAAQLVLFQDFTSSVDPKQNQVFGSWPTAWEAEFSDVTVCFCYNRTTIPFSSSSHLCPPTEERRKASSSSSLVVLVSLVCDGWVFLLSVSYSLDFSLSLSPSNKWHTFSQAPFVSSRATSHFYTSVFFIWILTGHKPRGAGEVLAATKRGCFTLKMLLSWGNIML